MGPPDSSQVGQNATSMSTILLEPLNELQSLSHTLFLSLSPAQSKPPPPPSRSVILACDKALSDAVNLAFKHQMGQRRIEALETEVLQLETRCREVCMELEAGKKELEDMIAEGEERIEAIEKAKEASIPYPELLAYAQSISAFTSAPPNMPDMNLPGQPPPPLFFPPFPNEEKMRRGRLNAEAPLGLLGETHSVGRRELLDFDPLFLLGNPIVAPTVSPKIEAPLPAQPLGHGAHPYRHDMRAPGPQPQIFDLDLDLNPDL
ncbi:hypothetical protein AX15_002122 [Amanita polypyramis BW_CC]|nr:hypothetical protein AX15_002122 [Amanita polypyramis BW_CC]